MSPAGLFLVDTSAGVRVGDPAVHAVLTRLGTRGLLATCPTIDLEIGFSARSPGDYRSTSALRSLGLTSLELSREVGRRALAVQAMLVQASQHRAAGVIDLLTAAVAELNRATVLHYDADFEHIAEASGQSVEWVVPRGTAG